MPPADPAMTRWFAEHVQPHEAMLRAWLRNQFPNEDDIDDVIQETTGRKPDFAGVGSGGG